MRINAIYEEFLEQTELKNENFDLKFDAELGFQDYYLLSAVSYDL